jgi:hypothetical protein
VLTGQLADVLALPLTSTPGDGGLTLVISIAA